MDGHLMWGWPIIGNLFLAGVGAGAMAVSSIVILWNPSGAFRVRAHFIARLGAFIGPLPVMIGAGLLIFELGRPFRAFNIMTSNFWYAAFNPSPMNWGGWFILLFCVFATIYALAFVPWRAWLGPGRGERLEAQAERVRAPLAAICTPSPRVCPPSSSCSASCFAKRGAGAPGALRIPPSGSPSTGWWG